MVEENAVGHLTREQMEQLLYFQDITGLEDMGRSQEVLETYGWNVEAAAQHQLSIGEPGFSGSSAQNDLNLRNSREENQSSSVDNVRPRSFLGMIMHLLLLPLNYLPSSIVNFFGYIFQFIRPDPRRYLQEPLHDILSFVQKFELLYGPYHPTFYRGSYSQALSDAKRDLQFLLVYLHCEDHKHTDAFCRTVLTNHEVICYVNDNMLFWACSVTSPEGYKVSQALRENSYPAFAVIVLRENRMTVVGRIEGPVDAKQFVGRLRSILADSEVHLLAARVDRNERNFTQHLRKEQDEAYLESLKADQEKERRKQELQQQKEREENMRRASDLAAQKRKEDIQRQKIIMADQIPHEPPASDPNAIKLSIKLPNGKRLERRFHRDHSLRHLYYFVFCHPESPDDFEIASNFPKRILNCKPTFEEPETFTFAEAGIGKSEMLFVYDLDA